MAFEQTGQGGLTEGGRSGTGILSRQRAFQLANNAAFGTPGGGGIGGVGGGGSAPPPNTAVPTVTSAQGAGGVTPLAGTGTAGAGAGMGWNEYLQLIGMGLGFAGNLMGEDDPTQLYNRQGTFAGTGMDPRKLAEIQSGLIGGFGDLVSQVTSRPIDLSGSIVQQPPTFTGGPLPFNVGVTGVDPAIANPALVQVPGLDTSQIRDALDAITALGVSNISGQDLAGTATEGERLTSRDRDFSSRSEPTGFAVPRTLGDPGKGMFPGEPIELSGFQKEFIDEEKIRRGIQEATQESPIASQVRRRQQTQVAAPAGLDVLQQAATQPGKGVQRRRAA